MSALIASVFGPGDTHGAYAYRIAGHVEVYIRRRGSRVPAPPWLIHIYRIDNEWCIVKLFTPWFRIYIDRHDLRRPKW